MMTRVILSTALILVVLAAGCGHKPTKVQQARQLLFKGQHDQARRLCDEVLSETPTHVEALLVRGQIKKDQGDFDAAEDDFATAIELDRTSPEGYFYRYQLYNELANTATDQALSDEWLTKAAADYNLYLNFNPAAAEAGLHPASLPKRASNDTEFATLPDPDTNVRNVATDESATPPEQSDGGQEQHVEDTPPDSVASSQVEAQGEQQDSVKTTNEWLAERQAEARRRIRELDLGGAGELPEMTLPPHLELQPDPLLDAPTPPVVRFDLSAPLGSPVPTPRKKKRPHTTGFVPESLDEAPVAQRSSFRATGATSLSPFVTPVPHTTGIVSGGARGRSSSGSTFGVVWSPWFGQQAARTAPSKSPSKEEGPEAETSKQPKQVISMALPNTAPTSTSGTSVGLLPVPWLNREIPTTGANTTSTLPLDAR